MKLIKLFSLALALVFVTNYTALAGKKDKEADDAKKREKEEKKREKEELKQYKKMKPEQIKALKNGFDKLSTDLNVCTVQKDSMNRRFDELNAKIMMQDSAVKKMEEDLAAANAATAKAIAEGGSSEGAGENTGGSAHHIASSKGIIFAVQLGAFKNFNLTLPKKGVELESEDGVNKYLLGMFHHLNQAEAFKKEVQRIKAPCRIRL